jgi:Flp pilus assembly protein TadD
MPDNRRIILVYLFLTAAALIAYSQVGHHQFVYLDDDVYVTENPHIQNGISLQGIQWALTTGHCANWHPLTWLSHMLDIQIFGLNPQGHHFTNLLFHIANVLLLFFVLHRMTKATWQSAFAAALFALHPLHVESVAWVAERKDVLSTFFFLLTLGAYGHYVRKRRFRRYLAVFVFFTLGLMAKPMLVTLPFVLLLLDYWPLDRFAANSVAQPIRKKGDSPVPALKGKRKQGKQTPKIAVEVQQPVTPGSGWMAIRSLIPEKIPLFFLSALSCIATYVAQNRGGAVVRMETFTPGVRIANALVSYILYIKKMIWPANLAVFYPHPGSLPLWQVLGAAFLLVAITFAVFRTAKNHPYLPVGWLWFAGTLVPVIGIVQVGAQAMADRYTYIPSIGIFIAAAWGIPELLKKRRYGKEVLAASSALCLLCLFILTWKQVGYWRDGITLFDHTLRITKDNYSIHNSRGRTYFLLGDPARAIEDFDSAVRIAPTFADAFNNRGMVYEQLGNHPQAIADFDRAIQINAKLAPAYNNRGNARDCLGDHVRAVEDFDEALKIDPGYAQAYNNRGITYDGMGNYSRAIEDFDRAIAIDPVYAGAYYNRGRANAFLGNKRQALDDLKTAARLGYADAGQFLKSQGISW